ncbi:MAG: hypothetical protein AABY36_03880 [Campylobacterota bacterium]
MIVFEASKKRLEYILVNPKNKKHIEDASLQEREGFGTGIDPQELPEVLRFIAGKGYIWLQYAVENGVKNPTGVIELLPLEKALEYDPNNIATKYDISTSPLTLITRNQENAFRDARKFADDKDIIYHHGISMSRREKGYGTLLLNHALNNTPNARDRIIICYIDAAQLDEESQELIPATNESSYTLHMKAGFVLAGIVKPPVYDDAISYYSVLRSIDSKPFKFSSKIEKLNFSNPNVNETIERVRQLTSIGYVGTSYNRKSHEMTFMKLK